VALGKKSLRAFLYSEGATAMKPAIKKVNIALARKSTPAPTAVNAPVTRD
jgi:hypothetical protein